MMHSAISFRASGLLSSRTARLLTPLDNSVRDTQCVVFLSNFRRRKGVIEALDAALMALREVPSARVIFVGDWEEGLERELRSRGSENRGSRVPPPGVRRAKDELLATAGILLFPPREPEGHPRVVLEAMAAGLPVITTDSGAIAETVRDGITGFVLPDPDPVELAVRLVSLLTGRGSVHTNVDGRAVRVRGEVHTGGGGRTPRRLARDVATR